MTTTEQQKTWERRIAPTTKVTSYWRKTRVTTPAPKPETTTYRWRRLYSTTKKPYLPASYQRTTSRPRYTYSWQATTRKKYFWERLTTAKTLPKRDETFTTRHYSWQRLTTPKPVTRKVYTRRIQPVTPRRTYSWETTTTGASYFKQYTPHQYLGFTSQYPLPGYLSGSPDGDDIINNDGYDPYILNLNAFWP